MLILWFLSIDFCTLIFVFWLYKYWYEPIETRVIEIELNVFDVSDLILVLLSLSFENFQMSIFTL